MGQDRLNGLAIMHAHQDIPVDLDKVIDDFVGNMPEEWR